MNTQSQFATFLLFFLAHPVPNYDRFYKAVAGLKKLSLSLTQANLVSVYYEQPNFSFSKPKA